MNYPPLLGKHLSQLQVAFSDTETRHIQSVSVSEICSNNSHINASIFSCHVSCILSFQTAVKLVIAFVRTVQEMLRVHIGGIAGEEYGCEGYYVKIVVGVAREIYENYHFANFQEIN